MSRRDWIGRRRRPEEFQIKRIARVYNYWLDPACQNEKREQANQMIFSFRQVYGVSLDKIRWWAKYIKKYNL